MYLGSHPDSHVIVLQIVSENNSLIYYNYDNDTLCGLNDRFGPEPNNFTSTSTSGRSVVDYNILWLCHMTNYNLYTQFKAYRQAAGIYVVCNEINKTVLYITAHTFVIFSVHPYIHPHRHSLCHGC